MTHETTKRPFPTIGWALVLFLLGLAFTGLIILVTMFFPETLKGDLLLTGVLNGIPLAVLVIIGYKKRKGLWGEVFPFQMPKPADFFFLLIAALGLSILMSEVDNIFRLFFPVPQYIFDFFMSILAGGSIFASLVIVSLIAPFTEEFFFRGIILKGFLENYKVSTALIVSSFLFAFFHLNPWQFFGAFFGGLVLGWIYYRTGNLLLSLLLHGFFNTLPVLLVRFNVVIDGYSNTENLQGFQPPWFDGAGVLLLAAGIWYFQRRDRKDERVT